MSSGWDQSEKMMSYNKSSETQTVPLAEHKILKEKYENLEKEHEALIKNLELLEETQGFTVDDLLKNRRESLVVTEEDIEKFVNRLGDMKKKLEMFEKDFEYFDETEMNGMDSATAEEPNVSDIIASNEVISDDDEGNQRESKCGHSKSTEFYFEL